MANPNIKSVSVTGKLFDELKQRAKAMAVPMSWVVEAAVCGAMGVEPENKAIASWANAMAQYRAST